MAAIGASRPLPRAPSEGPLTQPTAHSTVAEGTALPSPNLLSRHTQHRCEPTRVSPCRTGGSSAQRPPTDLIQNLLLALALDRSVMQYGICAPPLIFQKDVLSRSCKFRILTSSNRSMATIAWTKSVMRNSVTCRFLPKARTLREMCATLFKRPRDQFHSVTDRTKPRQILTFRRTISVPSS